MPSLFAGLLGEEYLDCYCLGLVGRIVVPLSESVLGFCAAGGAIEEKLAALMSVKLRACRGRHPLNLRPD